MSDLNILVFLRPNDPGLPALPRMPSGTRAQVAHNVEDALALAPQADALLVATGNAATLERIWRAAPRLRWIHTRPAASVADTSMARKPPFESMSWPVTMTSTKSAVFGMTRTAPHCAVCSSVARSSVGM